MRLRNYTIGASLTEAELLNGGFERVSELLSSLKPFVSVRTFPLDSSATKLPVPHRRPHRTTEGKDLALKVKFSLSWLAGFAWRGKSSQVAFWDLRRPPRELR
jgi:hypothetical protein